MGDYHALTGNLIQSGDTLKYTNTFNFHHRWYKDGVPIPNSDTTFVVPVQSGCYTVKGWYNYEKCGTFSPDSICVVVSSMDEANNTSGLSVYPNPTNGILTINCGNLSIQEISLTDITGKPVLKGDINKHGNGKYTMDISRLSKGNYLIKVITTSGIFWEIVSRQ